MFLNKALKYLGVVLIKTNDKTYNAFNNFKAKVENQNNKRIEELFINQSAKYTNKRFQINLNKYGIIHSITPAYI